MSMIRINLLPEEYRKSTRTPIKLMASIAGIVAVNAALVAWLGYVHFNVELQVESEKSTVQSEMGGLKPQLDYYTSLESESKQYKSREQTLASITKSRICWTKKLDELIDVCSRGGDGERHLVWFDDLQVVQNLDPKAKVPGTVSAAGHSGSDKFGQVANFLEDLAGSSFISDFEKPSDPEGTVQLVDETLVPPAAWSFPLKLKMKPREDSGAKPAAKGGKPAAKGARGAKPSTEQPAPAAKEEGK
jgi:Tfp pilus assembly protein PilN